VLHHLYIIVTGKWLVMFPCMHCSRVIVKDGNKKTWGAMHPR